MTAFLPLASNAGWFEGEQLLDALALRLKVLLLIEESLVIDPGACLLQFGDTDVSEQMFIAGAVPWPRDGVGIIGITRGAAGFELRMDWTPLLRAAGATSVDGVRLARPLLLPEQKRALREQVDEVSRHSLVLAAAPKQQRVREVLVKHWLLDVAGAAAESASLAIDARATPFAVAVERALSPGEPSGFSLRLHDVRSWTWEGVLRYRASSDGRHLRALVAEGLRNGKSSPVMQVELDRLTGRQSGGPEVLLWHIRSAVGEDVMGRKNAGIWIVGASHP